MLKAWFVALNQEREDLCTWWNAALRTSWAPGWSSVCAWRLVPGSAVVTRWAAALGTV